MHLGSTLRSHFGTSGPPWRTTGAVGWTRGGLDFSLILGRFWDLVLKVFWAPRLQISLFFRARFQITFSSTSESNIRGLGLKTRGFCQELIAKIDFSQKSFLSISGSKFVFLEAFGSRFPGFLCLENKLGNEWLFGVGRISSSGSAGGIYHRFLHSDSITTDA